MDIKEEILVNNETQETVTGEVIDNLELAPCADTKVTIVKVVAGIGIISAIGYGIYKGANWLKGKFSKKKTEEVVEETTESTEDENLEDTVEE